MIAVYEDLCAEHVYFWTKTVSVCFYSYQNRVINVVHQRKRINFEYV